MRLIGYVRVSTIGQEDGTSLEAQERKILAYAEVDDYEVVEVVREVGSGKSADARPEFLRAIEMLKNGGADGLIVAKLDRLGRNVRDVLKLVDEVLKPHNKELIIVENKVDTSTPTGRAILTFLMAMAELERGLITERTQNGRKDKAAKGGFAFGSPEYGKRSLAGELVADEAEQEVIEIIRKHRRSGKSFQAIADFLNSNGYTSKRGKIWHYSSVRNVLEPQGRNVKRRFKALHQAKTSEADIRAELGISVEQYNKYVKAISA